MYCNDNERLDKWGMRPLGYAAMRGNHEAIRWCFHLGCGKDYKSRDVHRIMELAEDKSTKKSLYSNYPMIDLCLVLLRGFEQVHMKHCPQEEALSVQPWLEYFGEEGQDLRAGISLQTPLHKVVAIIITYLMQVDCPVWLN